MCDIYKHNICFRLRNSSELYGHEINFEQTLTYVIVLYDNITLLFTKQIVNVNWLNYINIESLFFG